MVELSGGLGEWFDPTPREKDVPNPDIFAPPLFRLCINGEWASFLSGVLSRLEEPDLYTGSDEDKQRAAWQWRKFQVQFAQAFDTCSEAQVVESLNGRAIPLGAVLDWPEAVVIPDGFVAANGQSLAVEDYPELAASVPSLVSGDFIVIPLLNGSSDANAIYTAGTTNQNDVGNVIGSNLKAITERNLPDHDHYRRDDQASTISPLNTFPTSGNRFVLDGTAGAAGSQATTGETDTGTIRRTDGTFQNFNVQPNTYVLKKIICVEPQFVQVAEAGPEGPPGPKGDDGSDGSCADCDFEDVPGYEEEAPEEIPEGFVLDDLDRICSGAERVAREIVDDIIDILDWVDAIALGIESVPPALQIGGFAGMFLDYYSSIAPLVSATIRSEIDESFIEQLQCDLYCCVRPSRNFNKDSWDCFKQKYQWTFTDFPDTGIPTSAEAMTGAVINMRDSYPPAYRAYTKGVVDESALCRATCECSSCNDAVTLTSVDMFDNANVAFSPPPVLSIWTDGTPVATWDIDAEVRVILHERQCVRGIEFTQKRGATVSDPDAFELDIAGVVGSDGCGGFGECNVNINLPAPIETAVFVFRVPDIAKGSASNFHVIRSTANYKRYD